MWNEFYVRQFFQRNILCKSIQDYHIAYMLVCMYLRIDVHMHWCLYVCVYILIYMYACVYVGIILTQVCTYVCICLCTYAGMHVCWIYPLIVSVIKNVFSILRNSNCIRFSIVLLDLGNMLKNLGSSIS